MQFTDNAKGLDPSAPAAEGAASASRAAGRAAPAKRVVFVFNELAANGTTHFFHIFNLTSALRARGWDVALISEKGGEGTATVAGQPVTYLAANPAKRLWRLALALARLRRDGHRLIFVRIGMPPAILAGTLGRLLGFRTLYWQSGTTHDFDHEKSPRERWLGRALLVLVKASVHGFVTGPETMVAYYRDVVGVPERKLRLLYNDIDLGRFNGDRPGKAPDAALRVLLVHRFSPVRQTGLYMPALIERLSALAKETPVELVLIGEGPELPALRAMTHPAPGGLTVRFLGAIPNVDLPEHYAAADVFIMPSYREGFPRVVVEAMASGLPIVSTDAGGVLDLVGPLQRGFVVDRDDADGFADAVVRLLRDEGARRALSAENLEQVRRYSTPAVAAMYDRVLSEFLPGAHR